MFGDVGTSMKLQNAIAAVVEYRSHSSFGDHYVLLTEAQDRIASDVSHYSLTVTSCLSWMNQVSRIDRRLSVYFTATTLPVSYTHLTLPTIYSV